MCEMQKFRSFLQRILSMTTKATFLPLLEIFYFIIETRYANIEWPTIMVQVTDSCVP